MTRIVAGRFQTLACAQSAVRALKQARCASEDVDLFFIQSPGQHGALPVGGEEHADPGARGAEKKALAGAAVGAGVGLLAGSLAGPLGAAAGAAVGGYTGSLAGTLTGLGSGAAARRPAGVMVAVNVGRGANENEVVELLRASGADPVESVEGRWRQGGWSDFDPLAAPREAHARGRSAVPEVVYRVFPGGHGNWNVFEGDLGKLLSEFPERQEAVDYAASLARMKRLAVVEIYRAGGVLESSRAYSSSDPY